MNWSFWQAVLAAWVVASAILYFPLTLAIAILGSYYDLAGLSGVLLPGYAAPKNIFFYLLLLLAAIYLMCEIMEKIPWAKGARALKLGAQFGLLVSIPLVGETFFFDFPRSTVAMVSIANVIAFSLAALVYSKIDSRKRFVVKNG